MTSQKLLDNCIKFIPVCCLFLFSCNGWAQPYQVGHTTITFVDPSRNDREVETEIFYPADVAGDNVAMTSANADQFPVLAFGHGFLMGYDAYQYLWEELVAH